jgi:hypothetical protein
MTKDEAEDIKRHFDVVAEQLDSSIQAVAEGVAVNTERIERLESETRAGFARVDLQFARVDSRFTSVDSRFGRMDSRFDRMDSWFDRLEREMRQGFDELGERVERVESKQTT